MKTIITNYKDFVNERYMTEEVTPTRSVLPPNLIKPENIFDAPGAENLLNMLTSKYNFSPVEQAVEIGPNDVVRFYHGMPGTFTSARQSILASVNKDVKQFGIEAPKTELYARVMKGDPNDPQNAELVDVVGVLAATNQAEGGGDVSVTDTVAEEELPLNPENVNEEEISTGKAIDQNRLAMILRTLQSQKYLPPSNTNDIYQYLKFANIPAGHYMVVRKQAQNDVQVQRALFAELNAAQDQASVDSPEKQPRWVVTKEVSPGQWDGYGIIRLSQETPAPENQPEMASAPQEPVYENYQGLENVQDYAAFIKSRYGVDEELSAGQKKLPKGLQDAILKKQGETPKAEDEEPAKKEDAEDSKGDEDTEEKDQE